MTNFQAKKRKLESTNICTQSLKDRCAAILWRYDVLMLWRYHIMPFWCCDIVTLSYYDVMTLWHCDVVILWHFNVMKFWRHNIMMLWYCNVYFNAIFLRNSAKRVIDKLECTFFEKVCFGILSFTISFMAHYVFDCFYLKIVLDAKGSKHSFFGHL